MSENEYLHNLIEEVSEIKFERERAYFLLEKFVDAEPEQAALIHTVADYYGVDFNL